MTTTDAPLDVPARVLDDDLRDARYPYLAWLRENRPVHLGPSSFYGAATHSTVRGATVGDVQARFSGMCAYRALVPVVPGDDLSIRLWLGPGRHIVAYPGGPRPRLDEPRLPEPDWHDESWTAPCTAADLRHHFRDWLPALRAAGPRDRTGIPVGAVRPRTARRLVHRNDDAAHPMLPFMAQGAAQAIEDAVWRVVI